jgi:hypothetical protein
MVLAEPASACQQIFSGFVTASGAVSNSPQPPFTGVQTGVGAYKITTSQDTFHCGFPVMTFEPFGINGGIAVGNLNFEFCGNGTCTFGISLYNLETHQPQNNGWVFTIVSTSN